MGNIKYNTNIYKNNINYRRKLATEFRKWKFHSP